VDLFSAYPKKFYARPTLTVARELIGATLCRKLPNKTILHGTIVEVEAYTQDDPACHAHRGLTKRTSVMFGPPGNAYVYFIYGMYYCLNVVTEREGTPGAVLIRAVAAEGANGPGKLCRQWQIDSAQNGVSLLKPDSELWICPGALVAEDDIVVSERIGISQAKDYPWRFHLKDHPAVSQSKSTSKANNGRRKSMPAKR
jgi:DNA-3-methyladenine glycosylase